MHLDIYSDVAPTFDIIIILGHFHIGAGVNHNETIRTKKKILANQTSS